MSSSTAGILSSPGIGSGLDVNGIVSKLMAVESQPLTQINNQVASYQATLSAYGTVSSALTTLQTAMQGISSPTTFQAVTANPADNSILTATPSPQAAPGTYAINVSQLAQGQTLTSAGQLSTTATVGAGGSTTVSFQFGSIAGGNFVSTGANLGAAVAASGIGANSLSINGTTITTNGTTNSAKALATQINLATATTGVTATAQTTDSGALGAFTTTSGAATYSLAVGGVSIISNGAIGTTAANIDSQVSAAAASLTAAGISYSGTAAAGTLRFTKADGSNVSIQESGAGATGGFTSTIGIGTTQTFTGAVSLSSAAAITAGGTNPTAAGFSSGALSNTYSGATFTQDASQTSGSVTINSTNNSLQGIRDAINAANLGVTATIINDGSATPNHLVLASTKTGATASMKITVTGDAAVGNLLGYDPAGTQNLTQTSAAQSAQANVNGIAITGKTNTITGAIQGVTLNLSKLGTTTLAVARDTSSIQNAVNSFVNAYNTANSTLSALTAYNASTKTGGPLLGDSTTQNIQTQLSHLLNASINGASSTSLTNLTQVGITFQRDGSLSLDTSKLQTAITNNLSGIAALFSTVGTPTDSLISYSSSTAATKPGNYAVNISTLATQGTAVGNAPPGLTITAGSNDQLAVTIDGVSASVTLNAGTYTASALAAQVQSAINGAAPLLAAGSAVTVSLNASNQLTVTSARFGSASTINFGGDAAANLLGATPTYAAGVDVAGTINGVAATGSGQFLTGMTGSPTEGLKLQVTGGALGARGTVNFSQGYAYQMNGQIANYLGSSGLIAAKTSGINSIITNLGTQTTQVNARLAAEQAQLLAQFNALDLTISKMQSTQSFLTQQLAQISANTTKA